MGHHAVILPISTGYGPFQDVLRIRLDAPLAEPRAAPPNCLGRRLPGRRHADAGARFLPPRRLAVARGGGAQRPDLQPDGNARCGHRLLDVRDLRLRDVAGGAARRRGACGRAVRLPPAAPVAAHDRRRDPGACRRGDPRPVVPAPRAGRRRRGRARPAVDRRAARRALQRLRGEPHPALRRGDRRAGCRRRGGDAHPGRGDAGTLVPGTGVEGRLGRHAGHAPQCAGARGGIGLTRRAPGRCEGEQGRHRHRRRRGGVRRQRTGDRGCAGR